MALVTGLLIGIVVGNTYIQIPVFVERPTITVVKTLTETLTTALTHTTTQTITLTITTTVIPRPFSEAISLEIYVYDYKHDESYEITLKMDICDFLESLYSDKDRYLYENRYKEIITKMVLSYAEDHHIRELVRIIREISGDDDELFANLALQVTKFMTYYDANVSYIKNPAQLLAERTGVCVEFSLLYASILKAGGLKVAIIDAKVTNVERGVYNGSHMMVGVALPRLTAPFRYHRYFRENYGWPLDANVVVNGVRYFLAEPTSHQELGVHNARNSCILPDQIKNFYPSFVGEHTWDEVTLQEVILIP